MNRMTHYGTDNSYRECRGWPIRRVFQALKSSASNIFVIIYCRHNQHENCQHRHVSLCVHQVLQMQLLWKITEKVQFWIYPEADK